MDSIKSAVMLLSEADILKIGDVRYDLFLLILLIISRELFCAAPKQEPNVTFLVGDDVPCGGKEGEEDVEHANEERVLLWVVVVVVVRAAKNLLARRSADGRAKGVGIGALFRIPFL